MPNCFLFVSKETKTIVDLNKVDEEICGFLGIEVHPTNYAAGWFDCIGFRLAIGKTWDDMETEFAAQGNKWYDRQLKIVRFLRERYDSSAWYSPR